MSGPLFSALGGQTPDRRECSRARCTETAEWAIRWRNPKIHDEQRRKIWLACATHLETLREFLSARDFPLDVVPVATLNAEDPS